VREKKDVDALLKTSPAAKLFGVKDGARDEKDVVEGARAIRERLAAPGEFHAELKPGETTHISVSEEAARGEDDGIRLADLIKESLGEEWESTTRSTPEDVEVSIQERLEGARTGRSL
jgi:hypothetical protein